MVSFILSFTLFHHIPKILHFSHVYADKEALMDNALSMAMLIAEKSPVAIAGAKTGLNYARDHSVSDGLEQIVSIRSEL